MESRNIIVRGDNIDGETNWYWPQGDEGAWQGPLDDWQEHKIRYFEKVRKFDVAVQAGACCGMYTRFYAKKFKRVYAFEPSFLNFMAMTLNCPSNTILKFNCGLGDKPSFEPFDDSDTVNVGVHKFDTSGTSGAQILALDDFHLTELDFMQLDAEGFELSILYGAVNTIMEHRPVLAVERNIKAAECKQFLDAHDYLEYKTSGHADTVWIPKEYA